MYANRTHANRPTAYTAADHERMAAAVARCEAARIAYRRKESAARLAVFACAIVAAVALFYAASEPAPAVQHGNTWRAVNPAGDTVARGLTLPDCFARFGDCIRETGSR